MKWIVQNKFKGDAAYDKFLENLEKFGLDVTYVTKIPFAFDTEPSLPNDLTDVVCFGTIGLGTVAKAKNWTPGIWLNSHFDMRNTIGAYQNDSFSCSNVQFGNICTFEDKDLEEEFFIRPCADDKSFAGQVITKADFLKWQDDVSKNAETSLGKDSYVQVSPYTSIMIAPIQEIGAEYRFLVVDKKVVTGSRYKFGNVAGIMSQQPFEMIDEYIVKFAQEKAEQYQPGGVRAFVLDVALNENGDPKVLELGCINACGFYMCDTQKLIAAIEGLN